MKKVYFTVLGKRYKMHVDGDPKAEIMKRIEESLRIDKVEVTEAKEKTGQRPDFDVDRLMNMFNIKK
jgi:hypothetical protein